MSSPCTQVPVTTTGTASDASELTETRASKAIYVSFGAGKTRFASYAEKYAYIQGKASCTGTNFPCAGNQMLGE